MSDNEDYDETSESESGSESEQETIKPFIKLKGGVNEVVDAADVYDEDDVAEEDDDDIEEDDEDEVEDDEDDDEDVYQQEIEEEKNEQKKGKNEDKKGKKNEKQKGKKNEEEPSKINEEDKNMDNGSDDDDDEETDEHYLQKFDIDINKNYLVDVHPECLHHNYDEIETLTVIIRDANNIIIDPLHKTNPFLTKYERARILGQRAKQINMGAQSFIKIPDNVIDGIIIAELELKQKKIPFIIKRPLPNGACEYWNVNDLENILY
jgi:DNA-directed RNA polymerase subunit K/omega